MADNGLGEPVIGVTFDGTGYGIASSGGRSGAASSWSAIIAGFRRAAHLRIRRHARRRPGHSRTVADGAWPICSTPAADRGVLQAGVSAVAVRTWPADDRPGDSIRPPTSSVGRLFDAVAALVGLRDRVSYEGQAAIELEWLADEACRPTSVSVRDRRRPWPDEQAAGHRHAADDSRDCRRRERGLAPARIARRFHSTIVEMMAGVCRGCGWPPASTRWCSAAACFMNAVLAREVAERLAAADFAYIAHSVPPGDGGLSLGQLAIAAARLRRPKTSTARPSITKRKGKRHVSRHPR